MLKKREWINFMLHVIMACTLPDSEELPSDPDGAAQYVQDVLQLVMDGTDITVVPISYPVTTKIPLQVTVEMNQPHLFWYYPNLSCEDMCTYMADLLMEVTADFSTQASA